MSENTTTLPPLPKTVRGLFPIECLVSNELRRCATARFTPGSIVWAVNCDHINRAFELVEKRPGRTLPVGTNRLAMQLLSPVDEDLDLGVIVDKVRKARTST